MRLSEFVENLEKRLQFSILLEKSGSKESEEFLRNESERLYHGEAGKEIKRVALMVQPNRLLCLQAMQMGCDTILSHHRWTFKADGKPKLGELDRTMKREGMNLLSYHLCWDICRDGLADRIMKQVFHLEEWEENALTYRGVSIPGLAKWVRKRLSFQEISQILGNNFIRTERYLGHLDGYFDRLIVIPGGGLSNPILESLDKHIKFQPGEKMLVLSSGSGMDTREHYLEFFQGHEQNFSILDANHYDLEAAGVSWWATRLNREFESVECSMLYADHYINYTI